MDTVVNCIEDHFNHKDCTMNANCELVLLKGNMRELVSQFVDQLCEFYTEFDPDTLRIQLSILAEPYHSFSQGERSDTLHNVVVFLKNNKKIWALISNVLGQGFSGYANNNTYQLGTCLQCTEKSEVLPPYNHVEQLPQSSYDIHSS